MWTQCGHSVYVGYTKCLCRVHKVSTKCLPEVHNMSSWGTQSVFTQVCSTATCPQSIFAVFKQCCSNNIHPQPIYSVHQCPPVSTTVLYLSQTFVGPLMISDRGVQTKDTDSQTQEPSIRLQLLILVANSADLLRAHGHLWSVSQNISLNHLSSFIPSFSQSFSVSPFFHLG